MTIKSIIAASLLLTCVYADDSASQTQQQSQGKGIDRGDLNLNKAYLELYYNKDDIRNIRHKSEVIDKELEGTAEISESFRPLEKIIQTVDRIYLHPKRSVTVIFPSDALITHITSTFDAKFIEYDETKPSNLFTILSMPGFVSGDLTIYYSMNNKNYIMKLICEKYSQTADSMQTFYAVVEYKSPKILQPFDVMEAYKKEYGTYPRERYSFIIVGGITYKIIEDNAYGTLTLPSGKKYRIESQINQKN